MRGAPVCMETSSRHLDPADPSDPDDQAATFGELAGPTPEIYPGLISADRIDPDAVKVLTRLTRHGHVAYLVGGGVRDLLLDRSPKDFDIATDARPSELRRLFRNCRIIGRRFRLAHILFAGGKIIEVATFRRDPREREDVDEGEAADGGDGGERRESMLPADRGDDADLLIRQDNTFGDPHEDAIRRDFTINGLFYDLDREEVIDYVGGVEHLRAGVVRTIGEPDVRFREDPIRILRAIKFSARLDLGIAPDNYDAMVDLREELSRAAPPRVLEEILRLLRGGAAQRSIYLTWDVGVLAVVLPELCAYIEDQGKDAELLWARLAYIDRMKAEDRLPSDTVLLGALLYGALDEAVQGVRDPQSAFEEFFQEMTTRLSLPRRMRDRLRLVFAAQRRLARGHHTGLVNRDFYDDACDLFEIRLRAAGQELPRDFRKPHLPPPSAAGHDAGERRAGHAEHAPRREAAGEGEREPNRRRRGGRRRRPAGSHA